MLEGEKLARELMAEVTEGQTEVFELVESKLSRMIGLADTLALSFQEKAGRDIVDEGNGLSIELMAVELRQVRVLVRDGMQDKRGLQLQRG